MNNILFYFFYHDLFLTFKKKYLFTFSTYTVKHNTINNFYQPSMK